VGADEARELIAFSPAGVAGVALSPAPRWRDWMEATVRRNANRCLPLLMANEHGWVLLNASAFTATWDGRDHPDGVTIEFSEDGRPHAPGFVRTGFGHGIITFAVPYLFRTPPGFNLLARGPANWPKDGISPLEGLVETDWAVSTFTMNWKLTRPGHPVVFEEDEPFCMVVPQRRGVLESFQPEVRPLESDPPTREAMTAWFERRHRLEVEKFLSEYSREFDEARDAWQRDYFKGLLPDGSPVPGHQTKLRLKEFKELNRQA
jgi:Family of unknown function (DUF6065)